MSMSDPIADMLTRIRNAQMREETVVKMPSSRVKLAIAKVLKDEGYIDGFKVSPEEVQLNVQAMRYPIPGQLWHELKTAGLIHADAPTPAGDTSSADAQNTETGRAGY